jgi:hypothetical protein
MSKLRESQIVIRIAAPLRRELEREANDDAGHYRTWCVAS